MAVWVNDQLLQKEGSLIRIEKCIDLWLQHYTLEVILMLCIFGRIIVLDFPLVSMTYLAQSSWFC